MIRRIILESLIVLLIVLSAGLSARALADREPPHPAALYWSPDFQAEYKASDAGWTLSDDLTYWTVADYRGQYINFEGGYRRTVGQPDVYTSIVWLIGNSTMVSAQVADADTIASRLQAFLPSVRVVNVGMGGAYLVHEYYRLRTLPIAPGDTVVLYDGQLDAEATRGTGDVQRYRQVVADARQFTARRGAVFYHVLQPHICTVLDSEWDRYQVQKFNNICDGYARWWSAYQVTEDGFDLTHILDDARRGGQVFFFDVHHSSEAGNALIARALARLLFPII